MTKQKNGGKGGITSEIDLEKFSLPLAMILGGLFGPRRNFPQAKLGHDFDFALCELFFPFEIGVRYGGKSSENHKTPGKAQVIFAPKSPWNDRNL